MEWMMLFFLVTPILYVLWRLKVGKLSFTSAALHHQEAFWAATLIPLWWSFSLSIPLFIEHWWQWQFDGDGYSEFIQIFAFPISTLSLSIIFGVTVARFHHSYQRDIQIKETEQRNLVQYYQEHRKYIVEKLKEEIGEIDRSSSEKRYLNSVKPIIRYSKIYDSLFPSNKLGGKVELKFLEEPLERVVKTLKEDGQKFAKIPENIEHISKFSKNYYKFEVAKANNVKSSAILDACTTVNTRIATEIQEAVRLISNREGKAK